jgi:pyridoxine/pyridoxamine 5'-phosphate oxidase
LYYYLWGHTKNLVYEMKSQMIAELTGWICDATAQIRNNRAMLCRATREREGLPNRRWWLLWAITINYYFKMVKQ